MRSPDDRRRRVEPRIWEITERVLLGESQKVVALDRQSAVSTVAVACAQGLSLVGYERLASRCPVVLVMLVHATRDYALPPAAVETTSHRIGAFTARVPRPDLTLPVSLTPSERQVVRLFVEGRSHGMIALARARSTRTIANQLGSVFRKLGVSGRGELLARLVTNHASEFGNHRSPASETSEPSEAHG